MLPQPFPVYRSVLRSGALTAHVLSQYVLGKDVTCMLYTRVINDTYFVTSSRGRWVLRVTVAEGRSPAAVQSEIDMLLHLAEAGIAVGVPVAREDGQYVTLIHAPEGLRTAALFEFVDQTHTLDVTPEQSRAYGAALARMHQAAESYEGTMQRPAHNRHFFVEEPLARLTTSPLFAAHRTELDYLREAGPALWAQAESLPQSAPEYGFCHGDAMSGNALYGDGDAVTLIDFDYSGVGWRVYDLATTIWVQIVNGPAPDWSKGMSLCAG